MHTGPFNFKAHFGGKSLMSNGSYEYAKSLEHFNENQDVPNKFQSKSYLIDEEALKNRSLGSYNNEKIEIKKVGHLRMKTDLFQQIKNLKNQDQ